MSERRQGGKMLPRDLRDVVIGAPWAYDEGFRIDTVMPSAVVLRAVERGLIPHECRVVDLGCGKNPRNALYLAGKLDCHVDAVDLEPVDLPQGLSRDVRRRMRFFQSPVTEFELARARYEAAVLARLIQYVSPQDLELLMLRLHASLTQGGSMTLSYTAEGGILTKGDEYGIDVFQHPIDAVGQLLTDTGFEVLNVQQGALFSTSVPHAGTEAVTYDVLAKKE
ncbi:hypothetical protein A3D06_00400 [Candidatus Roizmanbacteria bacterium RIFCSPHIGHO2_02_FULL_40_9]|uniref:Methyltransferase domain-containing protein n=1 Tax=Candidatus Roizmanbacteria bacterium RIFCSPHIGHO2_02_FULL_40_9 TaxID=1802042 RepID=A0A1F7HEP9_9BACT|nr:MAG: hypothetical protein A3D06_00400 [Candidatus Roizmanbacteria bacterium RIFCSPHIGHO2_02_FULL_40_9]